MAGKYETLADLRDAYAKGELTEPLMLDNDTASVYVGDYDDGEDFTEVYSRHPDLILTDALDLLGIPHEHV